MAKKTAKAKQVKFDIASLKPEIGVVVTPRTNELTVEIYEKLRFLEVGQSYKMPISLLTPFTNAKIALKRIEKRIIIFRRLDSFNFRCWRLADDVKLTTRRASTKKKK